MKKIFTILTTILLTSLFFYFKDDSNRQNLKLHFSKKEKIKKPVTLTGQYQVFTDEFATLISNNKYDTIFENGNLGKYAIGNLCFRDLGFKPTKKFRENFLKDSLLQEECFKALCMMNKYRMRNYIDKFVGNEYNGIEITESGLLAGAHIVGATTLKNWFMKEYKNPELTQIIDKMKGHNLDYIVPAHTYKVNDFDSRLSFK